MIYTTRVVEKIDTPGPNWGLRVGVLRSDGQKKEQIGEYHRNYHAFFHTFCPFRKEGRDYALYSPDYSATRIMELPSCADLGGEEPTSSGFCPTDYHVPSYVEVESTAPGGINSSRYRVNDPGDERLLETTQAGRRIRPLSGRNYYQFGFVAGCIWGDDSTWKIQYLDLAQADKGVLRRDERFGYIILPDKLRLRDAIDMIDYLHDGECADVFIDVRRRFDLQTGRDLTDEH